MRDLGGDAQRVDIIDRALELGAWTDEERSVVSWSTGAARKYHLRTLADYAVTVCMDRGHLVEGATRGRWRLPEARRIAPHLFGRVFTASVGFGDDPVAEDWSADADEHVWFAGQSLQLSRGDHLFVLGAGRGSAVLGLYEVTSAGTSRTPQKPRHPERLKYAIGVRALAAVPPVEARPVPNLTAPRGAAHQIRDITRQSALYDAVRGYEVAAPTVTDSPDGAAAAAAARRPRPFDPDRPPAPAESASSALDREETLATGKARQGHHALLTNLVTLLKGAGWNDLEEIPAAIDLWASRPDGQRVIFEANTLSDDNETAQARTRRSSPSALRLHESSSGLTSAGHCSFQAASSTRRTSPGRCEVS